MGVGYCILGVSSRGWARGVPRITLTLAYALLSAGFLAGLGSCARPPSRVEFPELRKEAFVYTLQPGETLFDLAERHYGERSLGWALAITNELPDPERLEPGTSILIPRRREVLVSMFELRRSAKLPYNRGTYLLELRRHREAIRQLERAVAAAPEIVTARYHLGLAYLREGRIPESVRELEEVVRRGPLDRDFRYALGCAHLEHGAFERARREFKQALAFDTDYAPAQFGWALAAERLGKRREAARAWREYLNMNPEGEWAERARGHLVDLLD